MKSSTLAGIIVAVLLVVGGGIFMGSRDSTETKTSNSTQKTSTSNDSSTEDSDADEASKLDEAESSDAASGSDLAGAPTKAQVALHASEDDCWTIIDNVVYDITSYIPRHRGGDNILSACGVDGTKFFNGEAAGQNGGTNDHSNDRQALSALESLKVGDLAE